MRVDDHRAAPPRARLAAVTRRAVHGNLVVDGEHVVLALLVPGLRGAGVLYLFEV
jgi:hypothetical protein